MSTLAYYELKAAQALFNKARADLSEAEQDRVTKVAQRYRDIEAVVLAADEAQGVSVVAGDVDKALEDIRTRYQEPEAYTADLERLQLDEESLIAALQRDLLVAAVLDKVGARAGTVEVAEAELFYGEHKDRLNVPERRTARHILVTINDTYQENTREAASRRISMIRERLLKKPERFEEQALKHSECPTAMQGGLLGTCIPGQLYPSVEAALFALPVGGLSEVVESELGFHIVRCDGIQAGGTPSFAEVRDSLVRRLTEDRARKASQAWLKALLATNTSPTEATSAA